MEAAARARRLLLAQHALQAGAWRAWEFLVVVALVEARPASLLPTALFSFSVFCAVMLAGPALGAYLDAAGGLRGVEVSMGMHHGGVVAASLVIGAWFAGPGRGGAGDGAAPLFWAMVVVVCALGGGSSVGYTGAKIVVQRDWSIQLCGQDTNLLARTSSTLQAIDLVCSMVSPIVAGLLSQYTSVLAAVMTLSAVNVICWLCELSLARSLCAACPEVLETEGRGRGGHRGSRGTAGGAGGQGSLRARLASRWKLVREDYFGEPSARAGVPLAMLYMSVLTLGMLATAYLKGMGMSEVNISLVRAAGGVTGVGGTVLHPTMHRWVRSLVRLGLVNLWWLQACALVAALSTMPFVPLRTAHRIPVFCCGVVLSRYGLWSFDVAVGQIFQERVTLEKRGRFNGVQESLNSFGEMSISILAMVLHRTSQFWLLALVSLSSITFAACMFSHAVPMLEPKGEGYEQLGEPEAGGGGGRTAEGKIGTRPPRELPRVRLRRPKALEFIHARIELHAGYKKRGIFRGRGRCLTSAGAGAP